MGDTIITWNVTNWITITLMAVIGFMVVGAVGGAINKYRGSDAQ